MLTTDETSIAVAFISAAANLCGFFFCVNHRFSNPLFFRGKHRFSWRYINHIAAMHEHVVMNTPRKNETGGRRMNCDDRPLD
ncbi:MAG: hypothetical protein ACK54F_13360 [Planctomycetia bacterium]